MLVQQETAPTAPAVTHCTRYVAPALTAFGRVQDLTSAASAASKLGNGQESSRSWQVRT